MFTDIKFGVRRNSEDYFFVYYRFVFKGKECQHKVICAKEYLDRTQVMLIDELAKKMRELLID